MFKLTFHVHQLISPRIMIHHCDHTDALHHGQKIWSKPCFTIAGGTHRSTRKRQHFSLGVDRFGRTRFFIGSNANRSKRAIFALYNSKKQGETYICRNPAAAGNYITPKVTQAGSYRCHNQQPTVWLSRIPVPIDQQDEPKTKTRPGEICRDRGIPNQESSSNLFHKQRRSAATRLQENRS